MTAVIASFAACLVGFTIIGVLASRESSSTTEDYLVASRNVSPWLTALSAVATNNSGFMFIGLIGFAYRFGVEAVWLQAGWVVGDWCAWLWVHRRVREVSGRLRVASVPALLATTDGGRTLHATRWAAGALTLVFLGGYAAAQLKAGSTALHVLFGWDAHIGAVVGACIVVVYCFSGGIRASIWTDAAQSVVMLVSMTLLLSFAVAELGGPTALLGNLRAQDGALVEWLPRGHGWGLVLYAAGFLAGGFGAIGQPHILIRSMAIRRASDIPQARRIYLTWFFVFSVAAVAAGLYARALLPELLTGTSPSQLAPAAEHALPRLAQRLLPEFLIGLLLAGLFSATMSTADSQLLSCSAALTQDIAPRFRHSYAASKLATLGVTGFALWVALSAGEGVFQLVLAAWSALGASLGPLLLLRVTGRQVPSSWALPMMGVGLATVLLWERLPWADVTFKLLPGFLAPLALYAVLRAVSGSESAPRRSPEASAP
jgi:sodium/proline symporter